MKSKLTPLAKLLIVGVILGGLGFAVYKFKDKIIPQGNNGNTTGSEQSGDIVKPDREDVLKVGVVTWGGYAGGQYFNEGFKPNTASRYFKDYGFHVEFLVMDDFDASRAAFRSGDIDLLWATVDAFTTESNGFRNEEAQIIFQADWSRGGDAIVATREIKAVKDLKGKKIAFAEMTPSHTFLLWMLEAGNIQFSEITTVPVKSAIDAADLFKKGQVDAAIVWSPDDADCVAKVPGSKILQNTKEASNIIADVFVVKKSVLENKRDKLKKLLEGWMKGAGEINSSEAAKTKATKILAAGLGMPEDFCKLAIENVRLCTYGDNVNFFNMKGNYKGVTGEEIWSKMEIKYTKTGYIKERIPNWRTIGNSSLIGEISLSGSENEAEGSVKFKEATDDDVKKDAISSKPVSIQFASGASTLDDNMKKIIDLEFLDIAKSFANSKIRIEGNTDNKGNANANRELSKKRAQAVADYMIQEHGYDPNRFVIVGNGPDKPLGDNNSEEGRAKNRRTEFQLLPE